MAGRRILQIINTGARGGGAEHVRALIDGLREDFFFSAALDDEGFLGGDLRKKGIPVFPIPFMSGKLNPRAQLMLGSHIRKHKPALLHLHGTRAAFHGLIARGPFRNPPAIYTVHGLSTSKVMSRQARLAYTAVEIFLCSRAERVITVSEYDREAIVSNWPIPESKIEVIPNGVDTDRFAPARGKDGVRCKDIARGKEVARVEEELPARAFLRRQHGLPREALVIGTVARMVPQKNLSLLLKAAARLPEAHFLIVGDGPERSKLLALAETMGIAGRVAFAGEQADPLPFLQAMDIFALPSRWEGLPISLLEALSTGLPAVATLVGGNKEVLHGKPFGRLTPPDDPDAFAEALRSLAGSKTGRLGLDARSHVVADYSLKRCIARNKEEYLRILAT